MSCQLMSLCALCNHYGNQAGGEPGADVIAEWGVERRSAFLAPGAALLEEKEKKIKQGVGGVGWEKSCLKNPARCAIEPGEAQAKKVTSSTPLDPSPNPY